MFLKKRYIKLYMETTIFYRSSIKWFSHSSGRYASKHDALRAHLNYIEKSKDFRFCLGDANIIMNNSKQADKRVNSRIAFSFTLALPNSLSDDQVKFWMEQIRDIIANFNNMDPSNVYLGYHDSAGISGAGNKHIHVVGVNLNKDGKSITLGRGKDEPQKLNQELEKLIKEHGYTIKKDDKSMGHIGTRMRHDRELKSEYLELLRSKMELQKTREQAMRQQQVQVKAQVQQPQLIDNLKRNLAILRENRELVNRYAQDLKSKKLMNWYMEHKLSQFYQKCNEMEKYIGSLLQNPNSAQLNKLTFMVQEWNQSKNDVFSAIKEVYQQFQQKVKAQVPAQKPEPKPQQAMQQAVTQKPNTTQELIKELRDKKSVIRQNIQQLTEQAKVEQDGVIAENQLSAYSIKEAITEQKHGYKQAVTSEQKEIQRELRQEKKRTRDEIKKDIWKNVLTEEERQYVMEYIRKQREKEQMKEPEPENPSPKLGF